MSARMHNDMPGEHLHDPLFSTLMTEQATREDIKRALCGLLCRFVGLEPYNGMDGNPNWWMFAADVERLMGDLEKRNFKFIARIE